MRDNAGFDIYEEEFPHFLIAVQKVIDDNNIVLPLFLRAAARHAGIKMVGGDGSAAIPSFINFDGVTSSMTDDKEMEEILRHYQGCWQIYPTFPGFPVVIGPGSRLRASWATAKRTLGHRRRSKPPIDWTEVVKRLVLPASARTSP